MKYSRIDPRVVAAISQNPMVTRQVRDTAKDVANLARVYAPKDTGKGSRGIYVRRAFDQTSRQVSYQVRFRGPRWYMALHEQGWRHTGGKQIPGQHFLERAAREINNR